MQIQQREREGIAVLDLEGRLTAGEPAALLRQSVRDEIEKGRRNFILNLQQVDFIDSTGLGALVMCFTSLQSSGGVVKLLHLNRRNVELLVITKLATVFEIFNDEQDAVNSFFPNREIRRFDILEFVRGQQED